MKPFFTALAAILLFYSTAQAEFTLYTDEATFLEAVENPSAQPFDTHKGGLHVLGDIDTTDTLVDGNLVIESPPGFNVFNFLHEDRSFLSFGADVADIPDGALFATFVDAAFVHSRLDVCDPFLFLGVVSDVPFDLFSFTTDAESFKIRTAYYTLVPAPTSILFLSIGIILIGGPIRRGAWR